MKTEEESGGGTASRRALEATRTRKGKERFSTTAPEGAPLTL